MNTKAQIKMTESFAVLVVFFILLAIGLVFYGSIQRSLIGQQKEENIDKKAVELAQVISNAKEFQCSFDGIVDENCFDLYKLGAFARMIQDQSAFLYYRKLFGTSTIIAHRVYPMPEEEYVLYDAPLPDAKTKIATFIPLQLLNSSVGKDKIYAVGYLNITVYVP